MQWIGTSGGHYHAPDLLFGHSISGGRQGNLFRLLAERSQLIQEKQRSQEPLRVEYLAMKASTERGCAGSWSKCTSKGSIATAAEQGSYRKSRVSCRFERPHYTAYAEART